MLLLVKNHIMGLNSTLNQKSTTLYDNWDIFLYNIKLIAYIINKSQSYTEFIYDRFYNSIVKELYHIFYICLYIYKDETEIHLMKKILTQVSKNNWGFIVYVSDNIREKEMILR